MRYGTRQAIENTALRLRARWLYIPLRGIFLPNPRLGAWLGWGCVMALITETSKPTAEIIPFDPVAWRERFEERAAMLEHDAGVHPSTAATLAGQESMVDWMRNNRVNAVSVNRCCHCGRHLDQDKIPVTAHGGRGFVHGKCLVAFVAEWRGAAIKAMYAAGMPKQATASPRYPQHPLDAHLDRSIADFKARYGVSPGKCMSMSEDQFAAYQRLRARGPSKAGIQEPIA